MFNELVLYIMKSKMVKQILFWGFIIWSLPIHSQMQESYCYIPSYKDVDKETTFYIDEIFNYDVDVDLKKQRYLLSIGLYPDSDSHFIKLISYGGCFIKDSILTMYDHVHDIQMSARLEKKGLSFIRCFPFLKRKFFMSVYFEDDFDYHIETMWNLSSVEGERINFFYPLDKLFLDGHYKMTDDDYSMCIKENNYMLFYKGLLLSKGKLAKGGINEIVLVDMSLSSTFSVWLDGALLRSTCLPGIYKNVTFIKVD